MTFYDDVKNFHKEFHNPPEYPKVLSPFVWSHRVRLITEEFFETSRAYSTRNFDEFADGLVDLTWVVLGTAVESGLPYNLLWNEVRKANMAKFSEGIQTDHHGKILKPTGWKPPNIAGILSEFTKPETWVEWGSDHR